MNHLATGIVLIETTREQHRAIQTTIEGAQVVDIVIFHLDFSQDLVPAVATFLLELRHIHASQFLEVQDSLLLTDEGRSHTSIHLFATLTGLEGEDGTHMVATLLLCR